MILRMQLFRKVKQYIVSIYLLATFSIHSFETNTVVIFFNLDKSQNAAHTVSFFTNKFLALRGFAQLVY